MKKPFFSRFRFKKFGFIDLNKVVSLFRTVNKFLNTHRIRKQFYVYFLFLFVVPMILCIGFAHCNAYAVLTQHHVTLEVNSEFDAKKYIKSNYNINRLSTIDDSELDMTKCGSYEVYYKRPILEYVLYVEVKDSHAPKLKVHDYECETGAKIDAVDFVEDYSDETNVTLTYHSDQKLNHAGTYLVTVTAKDEGGNTTSKDCTLILRDDTVAPVVTDFGSLTYYTEQNIDYSHYFIVEDNYDPNPTITVDDSKVNYHKAGEYEINVIVEDRAHNKNSYKKTVKIIKNKGVVYLTFDDGPSQNTKRIIDVLKDYDIHATFFVTCNNKAYRKYIKEAYENGNTIALHTASHRYYKLYASVDAYFEDLNKVSAMVEDLTGHSSKYLRFPGGSSNHVSNKYSEGIMTKLIQQVKDKGYTYYDWNIDSGDAKTPSRTARQIYVEAVNTNKKNVMILLHDSAAKTETVKALPLIIDNYQKRGYIFKSVEEGDFICQHRTV